MGHTGNVTVELVVDTRSRSFTPKVEEFISCDDKEIPEIMSLAKNDEWIVFVETANGRMIQLGNEDDGVAVNWKFPFQNLKNDFIFLAYLSINQAGRRFFEDKF